MRKLQIIRTNRNAHIEFRQLASGESVAVIDNFLVTPDDLRAYASRHAKNFTMPPKSYPGITMAMDEKPMADVYRFMRSTLGRHFSFLRGGARFETYRKLPCYITESTEIAERLDVVSAKFNRLVFYSGNIPHSAQVSSPELLTDDLNKGRLTLNCFTSVRPKPG